jgi:hypothetical protein
MRRVMCPTEQLNLSISLCMCPNHDLITCFFQESQMGRRTGKESVALAVDLISCVQKMKAS